MYRKGKNPNAGSRRKKRNRCRAYEKLNRFMRRGRKRKNLLAASVLLGFPWADSKDNGVTIVTTALNDQGLADRAALKIAKEFWAERHNFKFKVEHYDSFTSIKTAIESVMQNKEGPVFVSDSGDNPTAGSTGDSTECFEALLKQKKL